jgi:hypothetical protein
VNLEEMMAFCNIVPLSRLKGVPMACVERMLEKKRQSKQQAQQDFDF